MGFIVSMNRRHKKRILTLNQSEDPFWLHSQIILRWFKQNRKEVKEESYPKETKGK